MNTILSPIRRNKIRSMNFEDYASEGNRIINEVADELGTNRDQAARITRAVLHALRDRISTNDAIQFAQGLPMALKGIFVDQYDISRTPVVIRNPNRFLEFIRSKAGPAAIADFPDRRSIVRGLQAVFYVLGRNMDYWQTEQVKHMLNLEIQEMIEGPYSVSY